MKTDRIIMPGGALKSMPAPGGQIKLGGHLVVYGSPTQRDLAGQFFTPDTYFGAHKGDGVDTLFHHSIEIKGLETFSERIFAPLKVTPDEFGLFAEWVGDASDSYDRAMYKAGEKGHLGLSSGTTDHMIRVKSDGEITRWPIVEGSFTPRPCEPRARAMSIKSLIESVRPEDYAELMDLYADAIAGQEAQGENEALREALDAANAAEMRVLQISWLQTQLIEDQMRVMSSIYALTQTQ